jgi:hypothetical protein
LIEITIPNNNINERRYIIDILFDEFLDLNYNITVGSNNYEIILENGNTLIIEDHFFNQYSNELEYLNPESIPSKVEFTKNDFLVEDDIPILYGSATFNPQSSIFICGIDIFASSFFMLTRWEEYVNKNRDSHNRFPAIESVASKNNFLDRPIVNEYVEMLWNMLKYLGVNQKRKKTDHQLFLTHDVDELYMWKSWKQVFRVVLGDILKRKNLSLAIERVAEYLLVKRAKINDPFDTFDWIMDKSESVGVKSRFYFMSGGVTAYDNRYKIDEPKSLKLIDTIKKRGHIIGIHPSYNAYNDFEQFKKEKELLEKISEQKIVEGREHYLRFEVPTTWQIWEDNGMEVDSTCGYADKEGFRCGTGDSFSVFNILTRRQLKLKERPLVVMDCTLFDYQKMTYDTAMDSLQTIRNNQTPISLLWHNSYIKHQKIYPSLLKVIK